MFINQKAVSSKVQKLVSQEIQNMYKYYPKEMKEGNFWSIINKKEKKFRNQIMKELEPKVIQLTMNYRSHNQILQLANSIVDVIELYFPKTIDKLQRESSPLDGPRPIVLNGFGEEDLQKVIMASSQSSTPKFGCNQVVIVRNQETKKKIPLFLK